MGLKRKYGAVLQWDIPSRLDSTRRIHYAIRTSTWVTLLLGNK